LIVGVGESENFVASDVPAFLPYTRKVYFIDDDTIAVITRDTVELSTISGKSVDKDIFEVTWDAAMAERGGYEHFMLKEINEQPQALRQTMLERFSSQDAKVDLPGIGLSSWDIQNIDKIVMVACGTAFHAAMVGKYAIEALVRIPVELDVASEFRYRDPIIDDRTLAIVISQSGETADTLAGLREAKLKGAKVLSITNVVGSSVARESDGVLYTFAGPEMAVASTKAYTTQIMMLHMITLYLAQVRGGLPEEQAEKLIERYDTYMANLRSLGFEVINYDYTIPMHQENICKIVENQAITGIYPAKPEDEDFCETQRNLINGATKRFKGFMVNSYGGKMTNGSC
jgi:glucosamine--fructose-6-phosphate aminotransferase (isomerizing)